MSFLKNNKKDGEYDKNVIVKNNLSDLLNFEDGIKGCLGKKISEQEVIKTKRCEKSEKLTESITLTHDEKNSINSNVENNKDKNNKIIGDGFAQTSDSVLTEKSNIKIVKENCTNCIRISTQVNELYNLVETYLINQNKVESNSNYKENALKMQERANVYKKENLKNLARFASARERIYYFLNNTEEQNEKTKTLLLAILNEITIALEDAGVQIYQNDYVNKFVDGRYQRVIGVQASENKDLDKQICATYGNYYIYEERVIQQQKVMIYEYREDN